MGRHEHATAAAAASAETPRSPRSGSRSLDDDMVVRASRWSLAGLLCLPTDVRSGDSCWPSGSCLPTTSKHKEQRTQPDFRRLKIALITIGISAVLMANVTFVGFLTPPNPPEVLLYEADPGLLDNVHAHTAINKTHNRLVQAGQANVDYNNYDYVNDLTPEAYAVYYQTVQPATFCENKLKTAFAVFNGVSFAFSLGTLFLTAVLPVYLKKSDWDLQIASIGAVMIMISMVTMVTAFILAGLVTVGVGSLDNCIDKKQGGLNTDGVALSHRQFEASVYVIIGVVGLLVLGLLWTSLRQTATGAS